MAYGFDSSLQAPALPAPLSNDVPQKDSFTPILVKIQHCLGWEGEVFSYQSHWKSQKNFWPLLMRENRTVITVP